MLIILLSVICVAAVLAFYFLRRHIGGRERIIAMLEQVAATMQMESARIERLPVLSLSGRYRTYQFNIQCAIKSGDGVQSWSIVTELHDLPKIKFYLQGERREGRLRKVMGLDVITTGDEIFDTQIMVFASDHAVGKKIFNPYLRERFLWAGFKDFAIEMKDKEVYLDLIVPLDSNIRRIRHSLESFSEFLNILQII